jgi:hypothetical protein
METNTMYYKVRKCTEPGVKGGGKVMYCATIAPKETLTIRDFAIWSEKKGTATESDILAVFYDQINYIETFCPKGQTIVSAIGNILSFHVHQSCRFSKEVTPKQLKDKFRYRLSKRLKKQHNQSYLKKQAKMLKQNNLTKTSRNTHYLEFNIIGQNRQLII